MRGRVPVVLVVLLCAARPELTAQQWTPEQQGLVDHITQCWDAWVKALGDETPEKFFAACPTDPRGHWWWTAEGAPAPLVTTDQRNWHVIRRVDDDWVSLRPIYVDLFGDVGIVHLYGYWRARTADGTVTTEAKRTEVFQRRDGRWVLIGAQATPVTAADAEPYRR
jgi:hypothetical protein